MANDIARHRYRRPQVTLRRRENIFSGRVFIEGAKRIYLIEPDAGIEYEGFTELTGIHQLRLVAHHVAGKNNHCQSDQQGNRAKR